MQLPSFPLTSKLPNWGARIKDHLVNGNWREALLHLKEMRKAGYLPADPSLCPAIMKACSNISFKLGLSMHACLVKQGYESFTSVGNSTLDFYFKWGASYEAVTVFRGMRNIDSVSWNAIIHGYLDRGDFDHGLWFFLQARVAGFEPNVSSLVLVIQAFRSLGRLSEGRDFHGFTIKSGFWTLSSVQNSLLGMYCDADMDCASQMFDEMRDRDVISWSVMISGFVQEGEPELALELFHKMVAESDVKPDGLTMVSVLKACSDVEGINMGRVIHGLVYGTGVYSDVFIGNSLIDMYSKCAEIDSAIEVFMKMSFKNNVTWNSMISGLVHNGMQEEAVESFNSMINSGFDADEVTLVNLLQICKDSCESKQCRLIHSRVLRNGHESNELLVNTMVDAYAKCNLVHLSWKLFVQLKRRNIVSWGIMIAGFTHCGMPEDAIRTYQLMIQEGERPNSIIISNLIEACSISAEQSRSKCAHGVAIRRGLASDVVEVGTGLVEMYSKCGNIESSRKVFDQIHLKNIISWSTMISAYGMNGRACDSLNLFDEMRRCGFEPNQVTALSILSACSHGGLVEEGLGFFKKMVEKHNILPNIQHLACLVDMLGRAGRLDSALDLVELIPIEFLSTDGSSSRSIWGSMLSACRRSQISSKTGGENIIASRVIELEPLSSVGYLLASNVFVAGGNWEEAAKMRRLVKEKGIKVVAGYSLVYVDNNAYKFVAGDGCNPEVGFWSRAVTELLHGCMRIDDRRHDYDLSSPWLVNELS